MPFNVSYHIAVRQSREVEQQLHEIYGHCRNSLVREFFRVPVSSVVAAMKAIEFNQRLAPPP